MNNDSAPNSASNHPFADILSRLDPRAAIEVSTAIVLVLISHSWLYLSTSLIVLIAVILSAKVRGNAFVWFGVSALWLPRLVFDWYHNEDHIYLTIYWCVALGLSYLGKDEMKAMAWNARMLIGLTFAFAVFWKVMTPDFRDGALLHYKLLFDYRMRQSIAEPFGGLSSDQTRFNLDRLRSLRAKGSEVNEIQLEYPDSLSRVAIAMTWWTIAIELLLAILFLIPDSQSTSRLRNATLMMFSLATYLVVPVLGFGSLFMTMGQAQCRLNEHKTRLAYIACQAILLLALVFRNG